MTKTLLLIPTELELKKLRSHLVFESAIDSRWVIELCGFGLIESAVQTSALLKKRSFERIVLAGIAGVYSSHAEKVGTASIVDSVVQFGVGSMKDGLFRTPLEIGFGEITRDEFQLETPFEISKTKNVADGNGNRTQLVSVPCAGQFREKEVLDRYPTATAEDMEGYAVACVANANQIPLTIVRGFSNVVGEDFAKWKIDHAIESAATILNELL